MIKTIFLITGIVMIFEGIPYFAAPDKLKELMAKVIEVENATLRLIGFIMMISGLMFLALSKL